LLHFIAFCALKNLSITSDDFSVSCCLSPIKQALCKVISASKMSNISRWTLKELDEHFANSNNPLEGYWRYLDRDMEDQWLRLGGRYTLALVKEQDAYDLIYIEGAQVNKRNWKIGMLKGKLKPTLFVDNFEAEWIDATMEMIDKDVQANLENGVILTFKFPVFKSQVRFQKVIQN